jgi:hypothetical protein
MSHSPERYNVPLCEEIVVQMEEQTNDQEYACTNTSFVIAMQWIENIQVKDPSVKRESYAHYHGLNAFTCKLSNDMPLEQNRSKSSMQIAGWLVQHTDNIRSSNDARVDSSYAFFQRILTNEAHNTLIARRINAKRTGGTKAITEAPASKAELCEHMKLSFLGNQHLGRLEMISSLPADDQQIGKILPSFVVSEWFCTPSFSLVAMSPIKDASKTTVFCITHRLDQYIKTYVRIPNLTKTVYQHDSQQTRPISFTQQVNGIRPFQRSSLPPELELELELL